MKTGEKTRLVVVLFLTVLIGSGGLLGAAGCSCSNNDAKADEEGRTSTGNNPVDNPTGEPAGAPEGVPGIEPGGTPGDGGSGGTPGGGTGRVATEFPFPQGNDGSFGSGSSGLKSENFQGMARFSVYTGNMIHGNNFKSSRVVATHINNP